MSKNCTTTKLIVSILIISLIFICIPAEQVDAKPVPNLEVDVWLDKGGQGLNAPGGQYQLGETVTAYFTATIGCQTRLTVSGPSGSGSWEQPAMYGPTYAINIVIAEPVDIGLWHVILEAVTSTGDQRASDTTMFTVVGPAPIPSQPPIIIPPQSTPTTTTPPVSPTPVTPPTQPQPETSTSPSSTPEAIVMEPVKINPKLATEVHALAAMKMADGSLPADLNLDATEDGKVTPDDARLILRWAVNSQSFFGMAFDPERLQVKEEGKDGNPDTWVYNFPRQEVAKDLFLDKSIGVEKASSGYQKQITLKFENEGDKQVEYWHTEVIPKSFAADVNDIQFSRAPDKIIDPDPSVGFLLTIAAIGTAVVTVNGALITVSSFAANTWMIPTKFDALTAEKQCDFIKKALEPHLETIESSARKHNIPPSLLAVVILNELIDYGYEDQVQEFIFNRGSSGMAQISLDTAIKHNLVDVTEAEIDKRVAYLYKNEYTPIGFEKSIQWHNEIRKNHRAEVRERIIWERLNQPDYAIEAAAREIDYQLNQINNNLDKSWGSYFLNGPINRSDIYANIKIRVPNEKDDEKIRLMKKQALALMVAGIYNTPGIGTTTKTITSDPYSGNFDSKGTFTNGVRHASWAATFVETLERCLPFQDEQESLDLSGFNHVAITANMKVNWKHNGDPQSTAQGSTGERFTRGGISTYGEGRWESKSKFVGSWEYTTDPGSVSMYGAFHEVGEITIIFDPDDIGHIVSFSFKTTSRALENNVQPRIKNRVIEGRDIYCLSESPSGVRYGVSGAEACNHISNITGTSNVYQDSSWSDAVDFNCTEYSGGPGLFIEFSKK